MRTELSAPLRSANPSGYAMNFLFFLAVAEFSAVTLIVNGEASSIRSCSFTGNTAVVTSITTTQSRGRLEGSHQHQGSTTIESLTGAG